MIPSTTSRVKRHTSDAANQRIHQHTETRLTYYAEHPDEIEQRLQELDQEWDIERTLEANASTLSFTGVALGALVDKRWLWLPAAVTAFLLQHAIQGWCPPMAILRRRGVRTASEIDQERYALKALRGDFGGMSGLDKASAHERAHRVLLAVR